MANREGEDAVGAGVMALNPMSESLSPVSAVPTEETRIAFGRFVQLMRRRHGYSVEKLAEVADVDASHLLVIEDDVHRSPEPRTVFQLARAFKVPTQRLMQLAGLASTKDVTFRQEAVRFAARSESIQKLTREEAAALDAFVAVLSQQETR